MNQTKTHFRDAVFRKKEKQIERLELFQLLAVTEENIAEIGRCIINIREVKLKSFGHPGIKLRTNLIKMNRVNIFIYLYI